jgi:hypothetical protein
LKYNDVRTPVPRWHRRFCVLECAPRCPTDRKSRDTSCQVAIRQRDATGDRTRPKLVAARKAEAPARSNDHAPGGATRAVTVRRSAAVGGRVLFRASRRTSFAISSRGVHQSSRPTSPYGVSSTASFATARSGTCSRAAPRRGRLLDLACICRFGGPAFPLWESGPCAGRPEFPNW